MNLLLAIAILALIALLVYRDLMWEQRLSKAKLEAGALLARKDAEMASQRAEAAAERKELYQRIQAPEVAVAEAHRERRGPYVPRKPVGADDDAAYQRNGAGSEVEDG